MRHRHPSTFGLSSLAIVTLLACTPSETPAPEPPPQAPVEPAPAPEPTPEPSEPDGAAADVESPEASETPAPQPEPEPQPSGPSTPPAELLTETDTAFMIDYANSAPKKHAETKCAGDDPKARAECLQKERSEFLSDVLTFKKSASGTVTFTIYRRQGSQLQEIYTVAAELQDKSPTEVVLKVKGRGKGTRPLFATQGSTTVTLPDDYTLLLEDPRFGALKYTARHGLVDK